MNGYYEVAYFDKQEATLVKEPTVQNNFTYDNSGNGGIINKFNELALKIKSIKGDIDSLNTIYKEIISKYEKFSNFETSMTSIINTMTSRIDNIEQCYKKILDNAKKAVSDQMSTDSSFMDDLTEINKLIGGGILSHFEQSHGGYSPDAWNALSDDKKAEIAAAEQGGAIGTYTEGSVDDKYTMSGDLDKIADDIIQGKYGNGEDRFAELEKQGYTLRDQYVLDKNGEKTLVARGIQDIVNEKMNGTYDPSKTPTYTSNGTDRGYPSSTEGYESQKAAALAAIHDKGVAQTNYYKDLQEKQASTVNPGGSASTSNAGDISIPSQAILDRMNSINGTNNTPPQAQTILDTMNSINGTNNTPPQAQTILDTMNSLNVNNSSISPRNYTKDIIRDAMSNSNTASTTSSGSKIYELDSDPVK